MQFRLTGLTAAALSGVALSPAAASAQTLDLSVAIPKLTVAEYHRPYVAIWLEKEGVTPRTIAVWYDFDLKGNEGEGTKWLRDVRQWWRASGRGLSFPADGLTGATRAPGTHKLAFTGGRGSMPNLTPGAYKLMIEAAREAGGREVVAVPFNWDGKTAVSASAKGSGELGAVSLTLKR
ncbi:MAG: DUF2271 domain-containing protein [Sphingomonas sp.]|uniref:DUF2271 domain-containing protein n=1 Tax=Sphingomonas sp. TaxID=28214 RepID=UPI0025EADCE3|nr:DUF2271 domain-containing protein [Sphingomonas sp.]MBX3563502.1 DUF2271 domain-containing protein [Sphingomonas sp.]